MSTEELLPTHANAIIQIIIQRAGVYSSHWNNARVQYGACTNQILLALISNLPNHLAKRPSLHCCWNCSSLDIMKHLKPRRNITQETAHISGEIPGNYPGYNIQHTGRHSLYSERWQMTNNIRLSLAAKINLRDVISLRTCHILFIHCFHFGLPSYFTSIYSGDPDSIPSWLICPGLLPSL